VTKAMLRLDHDASRRLALLLSVRRIVGGEYIVTGCDLSSGGFKTLFGRGNAGFPGRVHPVHQILKFSVKSNLSNGPRAVVLAWQQGHPRFVFHFTPTSCSWLNAVETFFAKLTRRRLKRGVFPSVVALQQAINRFIDHHNQQPKPFTWKADPKDIIAAAKRGHQTLETIH
jgi:transposase